jgi:hypothetical protein
MTWEKLEKITYVVIMSLICIAFVLILLFMIGGILLLAWSTFSHPQGC